MRAMDYVYIENQNMDVVLEPSDYIHIAPMVYVHIGDGLRPYAWTTLISVVHRNQPRKVVHRPRKQALQLEFVKQGPSTAFF
jgi:hypothetical protein